MQVRCAACGQGDLQEKRMSMKTIFTPRRLLRVLVQQPLALGIACLAAAAPGVPAASAAFAAKSSGPSDVVFGQPSPLRHEITPAVKTMIAKGLKWLARRQNTNGSFSNPQAPVAITALSGLAFVAGGSLPGQGPYAHNVSQALKFVLSQCQQSGLIAGPSEGNPMYSHGFATLFLAETYGEAHLPSLRQKLQKAVRLIVQCQNNQGGWRYQPVPMDADLSVTICQVMALRAARDAGIAVPRRTIERAIRFVRRLQNPDGGFSYMINSPGSAFPRSAAGVALLFYAGVYKGNAISAGVHYLMNCLPGSPNNSQGNFFYGNYYGTQAMFLAGGHWWASWWPSLTKTLIGRQNDDGSWQGGAGRSYGTAMALIALQIPYRLLPILQK